MTRWPTRLAHTLTALLGILLSLQALSLAAEEQATHEPAVEAEPVYWFQVELVVFTQSSPDLKAEYWNEQLLADYHNNAIQLMPSEGFSTASMAAPSSTAAPPSEQTTASLPLETLLEAGTTTTAPQPGSLEALPARQLPAPLQQEYSDGAFVLLDPEQREAGLEQARETSELPLAPINTARLERQGRRILLQQSWRQPVLDDAQSRSIVIRGGEALSEQQFELEGDLRLSLARYLHLRPNLYLTLQLPDDWQVRDPRLLEQLAVQAEDAARTQQQTQLQPLSATPIQPQALITPEPELIGATPTPSAATPSTVQGASQDPIIEQPQARYLTVKMDQPRRMRKNELHYLDHPLFGLLIRLTPFTPPVTEPVLSAPLAEPAASQALSSQTGVAPPALPPNPS